MTLEQLAAIPARTERVERPPEEYLPMQSLTRELAFDPAAWTAARQEKVHALFEGLAGEWHTRDSKERRRPLLDALERGGVARGGRCVEIGSGTGIHTAFLVGHFSHVTSVDISSEMLRLAPRRGQVSLVRADATRLPVATGSLDAVACVNAFLFPFEYARVLRSDGCVIFVSVNGDRTPIYLSPGDVLAALETFLGSCKAVTSKEGWGTWTVVRKATA
ncbi:MAG: class I SAM-dependent methyltransferase [Acidimicrobiales bacterium]